MRYPKISGCRWPLIRLTQVAGERERWRKQRHGLVERFDASVVTNQDFEAIGRDRLLGQPLENLAQHVGSVVHGNYDRPAKLVLAMLYV
jgi:hypothetical protein